MDEEFDAFVREQVQIMANAANMKLALEGIVESIDLGIKKAAGPDTFKLKSGEVLEGEAATNIIAILRAIQSLASAGLDDVEVDFDRLNNGSI